MKERPIIFSTDMVKAILDGRETQTRRVIKPQPKPDSTFLNLLLNERTKRLMAIFHKTTETGFVQYPRQCPYGQVGDRLWVRETFCQVCYKNDNEQDVCYKEDCETNPSIVQCNEKWTSSYFMPRWASRITLEITEVRVEQLVKIDIRDIHSEGICLPEDKVGYYGKLYVDAFHNLWDSINAKRGYSWEVNPWVWVINFKRLPDGR